jgi:hypothetical protein
MGWVMAAGYALEVCGLVLAGFGLLRTWRDNADGRPFLAGMPRLLRLWGRVTGRPHVAHGSGGGTMPSMTGSAYGHSPLVLDPEATVDEKLAALVAHSNRAMVEAMGAHAAADREASKRRRAVQGLQDRMESLEEQARAYTRRALVEGVPVAIIGLFLAGFGLLLQGLATWQTWPDI